MEPDSHPRYGRIMSEEIDHVRGRVHMLLSQAKANFDQQYGGMSADERDVLRRDAMPADLDDSLYAIADCPACGSPGLAEGTTDIDWDYEHLMPGSHWPKGTMWFDAYAFSCRLCGLELSDPTELKAAGMADRWTHDFDPETLVLEIDERVAYEVHRNKLQGRKG